MPPPAPEGGGSGPEPSFASAAVRLGQRRKRALARICPYRWAHGGKERWAPAREGRGTCAELALRDAARAWACTQGPRASKSKQLGSSQLSLPRERRSHPNLDFSRRLTIVFKRPSCELVHQEWLTTARSHTVASCDERGLACAAHTDVVYIHICGHVSAGSGHEFRIFPRRNNRCCSGANGRLPSRHWHPSQQ